MPDQAQLNCYSYTKNQLHVSIPFWDIGYSRILQSDQLRAPWAIITQELEFHQTLNLGWEVKYHNNSTSSSLYLEVFLPKYDENEFSVKIRLCQFLDDKIM